MRGQFRIRNWLMLTSVHTHKHDRASRSRFCSLLPSWSKRMSKKGPTSSLEGCNHKLKALVSEHELLPLQCPPQNNNPSKTAELAAARPFQSWFTYDRISCPSLRNTSTQASTTAYFRDMFSNLSTPMWSFTVFLCGWRKSHRIPFYMDCADSRYV
jgi:hypothetical protein